MKMPKDAKKKEDADNYKEIKEYMRLGKNTRIDWDPVKKKGLLMTPDGVVWSNREMMSPSGFARCLFDETKHFWDSEIAYIDFEEDVVMKKPARAIKEKAPKKIASPKKKHQSLRKPRRRRRHRSQSNKKEQSSTKANGSKGLRSGNDCIRRPTTPRRLRR